MFVIGANLASVSNQKIEKAQIDEEPIMHLERLIKDMGGKMPELKKFVLPGGSEASVHLHLARTIARRAERMMVRASEMSNVDKKAIAYINRLSSFLFVTALFLNFSEGIEEQHPTY